MKKPSILIVDDQPEILNALERQFKLDYTVHIADSGQKGLKILKTNKVAVILSDQRMPEMTGVEFLTQSISTQPDAIRILITAYADLSATIAAVNEGKISRYIAKPWEPEEIEMIVRESVEKYNLTEQNKKLTRQLKDINKKLKEENLLLKQNMEIKYDFHQIIGHSPKMLSVFKLATKVVNTPTTVLIYGETGTGKELLARAIHFNGNRTKKSFVAQNCGALPDSLLESELFGHIKGAFTGAVQSRKGLFEVANGGTIFLDEIADTSPAMQQRLLRVLQEGEIRPVGSTKIIKVDVRVIAATNKHLQDEVKAGRFREDLFYRLNIFPIDLPPLRERREDMPDLIQHFIHQASEKINKSVKGISQEAADILTGSEFPGNIRELENEMERAVTLTEDNGIITPQELSIRFQHAFPKSNVDVNLNTSLREQVESLEQKLIRQALRETSGNILKAAEKLGLSRAGLHKKLNRYHIQPNKM